MILEFNRKLAEKYHSNSQKARVLTESWMGDNMFCPRCGNLKIKKFENNKPVADFYCPVCRNEYELKSKSGSISNSINAGAYEKMIMRITSNQNPDFFFMGYDKDNLKVKDLILVPKHFFVPEIIEKRKPLSETARRAGWVGCNIILGNIPEQGRIDIIRNSVPEDILSVVEKVNRSKSLEIKEMKSRGWLFDVLNCINLLSDKVFTLNDIYSYEDVLKEKYPSNNFIQAKIRQQLQMLRDKGFIEFLGEGKYRKIL